MPLNVGVPIGSDAYATAADPTSYARAYSGATTAPNFFNTSRAQSGGGASSSLRYPLASLTNTNGGTDYLEIKVIEYQPPGFASGSSVALPRGSVKNKLSNVLYYIFLPMPQSLSDSNAVDWGEDRIDPLSGLGVGAIQGMVQAGNPLNAAASEIKNLIDKAVGTFQTGEGQKLTASTVAGAALNIAGSNVGVSQILSRSTGQIVNPNLELLFNGVTLRNFQFSFDFAPRSKEEGQQVKEIIKVLKKHMAAKSQQSSGGGTGLLIKSPEVFQLTFKSGSADHPFLFKMQPTALLNLSVDYAASGTYAAYKDGTPVHMRMNLTFKELSPIYQEDYNGVGGVGY